MIWCFDSHIWYIILHSHCTTQTTNSRGQVHSHSRCRSKCSYNSYRLQAQDLQLHNSHVRNRRFFCSKRNYAHPTTNPNEKKISRSVFLNLGPRVLRSHLGFRYYSFFVLLVSSPMEILLQGRKHLFDSLIIPHVHIYNWHPWLIFGIRCLKAYVMKYFPGNIP